MADQGADLVGVFEVEAARGTDERQERPGEVLGRPIEIDPGAQAAGLLFAGKVRKQEVGDERQGLRPPRC